MRPRRGNEGYKTHTHSTHQAKDGCLEVFSFGELTTLEDSDRVDDAHPSIKLATWDVVVHTLSDQTIKDIAQGKNM
jgi:hypothetical protein